MVRCRVADYDTWRPLYDGSVGPARGVKGIRVWRAVDDPNLVVIAETFESRAAAEALLSDPEIQAEMVAHGVDVASAQLDFLDDASS
jgi:quinol monooxygenase YgiN